MDKIKCLFVVMLINKNKMGTGRMELIYCRSFEVS